MKARPLIRPRGTSRFRCVAALVLASGLAGLGGCSEGDDPSRSSDGAAGTEADGSGTARWLADIRSLTEPIIPGWHPMAWNIASVGK